MTDCPRLEEMGVRNKDQIDGYHLSSVDYVDTLSIHYQRPKLSLLPVTRVYRFPRIQRTALINDEKGESQQVLESNSVMLEAIKELEALIARRTQPANAKDALLREIAALEAEISARAARLRELVNRQSD